MEEEKMRGLGKYLEQIQTDSCQDDSLAWQEDLSDEETSRQSETGIREAKHEVSKDYIAGMKGLSRVIGQNTLLKAYRFSQDELTLIARICHRSSQNGDQDYSAREICEMTPNLKDGLEQQLRFLTGLIDREILSAPVLRDHDYRYDPRALFGTIFRLNGLLWNLILGHDPIREAKRLFTQSRSEDPIDAALKMTGILFLHFPELSDSSFADSGICYGRSVNLALDAFLDQIKSAGSWKAFRDRYALNRFWQKCLLLIHFYNRDRNLEPSPALIASLLAKNGSERQKYIDLLGRDNLLSAKNLIESSSNLMFGYQMELTRLALNGLHSKGEDSASLSEQAERMIESSAYLHRIDPTQRLDQLILDRHSRELIVMLIRRLSNPRQDSLADWGLIGASLTGDWRVQQGCNILLHGVPGTGKTFIAGVIANELKRPLIQINASAIRGSYFGVSEKQARELFHQMREAAKGLSPVFLLNEGDQLIHRRLESSERSADHAENSIQSVFLEEMESFPGVLIITTNLVENLDMAMSRRFHYKLEIKAPDYEARVSLWRLHLRQSIPGALQIRVEDLARDYPFTGGQIRLVVQNACHEAFLRGNNARLTLDDLRKYATLECGTSFESSSQTIGFAV